MIGGLFTFVVIAGVITIADGTEWMSLWWLWLLMVAWGVGMYFILRKDWLAAGALWVQQDKSWVNVYELTRVAMGADGVNRVLRLTDSSGRTIRSLKLRNIQANPRLWDLVYNGIIHSVASGHCDISPIAYNNLRMPVNVGGPGTTDVKGGTLIYRIATGLMMSTLGVVLVILGARAHDTPPMLLGIFLLVVGLGLIAVFALASTGRLPKNRAH